MDWVWGQAQSTLGAGDNTAATQRQNQVRDKLLVYKVMHTEVCTKSTLKTDGEMQTLRFIY